MSMARLRARLIFMMASQVRVSIREQRRLPCRDAFNRRSARIQTASALESVSLQNFSNQWVPLRFCDNFVTQLCLPILRRPLKRSGIVNMGCSALLLATAPSTIVFLVFAIGLALSFEFVNGFHDTANAVATVIYTNTLKATPAVVWSGIWNLIGVLTSSGAVAFGIVALLPVELVINIGSTAGFAMVFALLLSAIAWNLGTWYLGLPASSSHTLIGSIMGVGLANSLMQGGINAFGAGVNWAKAKEVGMALLISPLVGFICAGTLLLVSKALIKNPALYKSPEGKAPPPPWIRGLLVLTCTGVSFAHGSNDGQKGMGLIVLILVGILPGIYALKMDASSDVVRQVAAAAYSLSGGFSRQAGGAPPSSSAESTKTISAYLKTTGKLSTETYGALTQKTQAIANALT
jgi:inorganic phosphate transporter, PiT family